jgi:hypothetical protein
MALDLPLGFLQTTFHHTSPSADGELVCTAGWDIRDTTLQPQAVVELISTNWITHIVEEMHSSITFIGTTGLSLSESGLVSFDAPASSGGSGSGTALPPAVSLLVQKRTGFAGKKNRGRMFIPGLPAEHLDGADKGKVTAFALSVWQPAFTAFLADIFLDEVRMMILHQEPNTDQPRPVTELVVAERVATQRGRQRN